MASEKDHIAVYDEDDDEDDEPLKDVVLDDDEDVVEEEEEAGDRSGDSDDSDETNSTSSAAFAAVPLSSSSAVSIAALPPSSSAPVNGGDAPAVSPALGGAAASAIVAMPAPNAPVAASGERKPFDDSRKLFQKLWTDEDEIELLRGFLEYNTQKGPNWSGHHHDTTAFYDRIKSRIQLDCNKNQMVEKLRRLKKKYRTVVSRISAGKEFVLKSPHDQTLFEISGKIWGNSIANRPELDDDDQNPNPSGTFTVPTPHIVVDQRAPPGFALDINNSDNTMMNMATPNRSRKRPRLQVEEKGSRNPNSGGFEPVNAAPLQAPVDEMVRSSLAPMLKEFIGNMTSGNTSGHGGSKGIESLVESLVSNAAPMNFSALSSSNHGDMMNEKWRKQMILELEVYSQRLELVQDQIKLSLQELRSRGH